MSMKMKCPTCSTRVGVREFIYGMPDKEPDPSKYIVGGCCISEDMPDYGCINCSTDFYKSRDEFQSRYISDGSGVNFQCKECKELILNAADIDGHDCQPKQILDMEI